MASAEAARRMPWLRYAVLGILVAAIWLLISLFSSAGGASADEHEPNGKGRGAVGAVALVAPAVEPVETVAEPVMKAVPEPAAPVVEVAPEPAAPVAEAAQEPAAPVVEPVVEAVVETAARNGANGTAVAKASGKSGDTASGKPTKPTKPAAAETVGSDAAADEAPKGQGGKAVGRAADAADHANPHSEASSAGRSTDGPGVLPQPLAIPQPPATAGDPDDSGLPAALGGARGAWLADADLIGPPGGLADLGPGGDASSAASDDPGAPGEAPDAILLADGAPSGGSAAPGSSTAGGGTGPGGAGAGGAGGASGTSDADFAAFGLDALASLVLGSVDDALPSSPVFGTDTTPD